MTSADDDFGLLLTRTPKQVARVAHRGVATPGICEKRAQAAENIHLALGGISKLLILQSRKSIKRMKCRESMPILCQFPWLLNEGERI
jgi:hypothetical protein